MFRVYDTNALWRHDEILRIRRLEAEIAVMQKEIDIQKQKAVAALAKEVSVPERTAGHRLWIFKGNCIA